MIEFLKRIFGSAPSSSSTAKERLRLVLMTDHLALAPEMIERLKHDLVDVISRYVEVDRERIEVNFEEHDRALAMLANIPILSVNRPEPPAVPPSAPLASASDGAPEAGARVSPAGGDSGTPPRRRRRRKKPQLASVAPGSGA